MDEPFIQDVLSKCEKMKIQRQLERRRREQLKIFQLGIKINKLLNKYHFTSSVVCVLFMVFFAFTIVGCKVGREFTVRSSHIIKIFKILLSSNTVKNVTRFGGNNSKPMFQYIMDWTPDYPEAEKYQNFKERKIPSKFKIQRLTSQKTCCLLSSFMVFHLLME